MKNNGLTIGIPAFNEEKSIERAVRSSALQCEKILVSDNASTDETESICKRLASEFSNLHYVRQEVNLGSVGNMIFIANKVDTDFIMILGAHDYIEEDYVDKVLPLITSEDEVECAMGSLVFVQKDGAKNPVKNFCEWNDGEKNNPRDRIWGFFTRGGAVVWATYGIFKTKTFNMFFTTQLPVFGPDSIFIANVLKSGKIKISESASYFADERKKEGSKSAYFERVTGVLHSDKDVDALVNAYRVKQYEIIKRLYPDDSRIGSVYRRFISMSRFKPFRIKDKDVLYFVFYIPAVVVNRIERAIRKVT